MGPWPCGRLMHSQRRVRSLALHPALLHCSAISRNGGPTPRSRELALLAAFDVAAVNFRGCGGEEVVSDKIYHLVPSKCSSNQASMVVLPAVCTETDTLRQGFTDDLHWILLKLHAEAPARLIYLSGISLGGNVVTKCLSELGENSSKINVRGAAVSCIPLNLVESTG